jgi:hypothetical protein
MIAAVSIPMALILVLAREMTRPRIPTVKSQISLIPNTCKPRLLVPDPAHDLGGYQTPPARDLGDDQDWIDGRDEYYMKPGTGEF